MKISKIAFTLLSVSAFAFVPKEFSTSYQQEYKSKISNKIKKSQGRFDYKYPGQVKFKQTVPNEMIVTASTKKTWILTPGFDDDEPAQVRVSESHNSLSTFFSLLNNGLKTNPQYSVKNKSKLDYELEFSKVNTTKLGIKSVNIKFIKVADFKNIKDILIRYTDKREVKLSLKDINTAPKFKSKHFKFTMPKGAKIIKN